MHFVVLTELGIVVLEGNKSVNAFAFEHPAADFVKVKEGQQRLGALIDFLKKLNSGFVINDESLLKTLKKESLDVQIMDEKQVEEIQANKPQILIDCGFAKNQADAMAKLRDFALQLSSAKVTEVSQSPDLHIIQGIKALDEIDVMINGLSSRLREWYGLHFPELDNMIDSISGYAQIVLSGKRDMLSKQVYEDAGFPESKVEMLSVIQDKSKGGDISDQNLVIVQSIAKQILEMLQIRREIEAHIENEMKTIAPNLATILGTAVGARILSKAGSLKKLSSLPASTIQVLGAEKALFRALKTGTQPPKHGILFQHPVVHAAPKWQRGKMARAIASKAAIAARVDVYGGGLNQTLLEKLNVRVTEISQKYKEPSQRPIPPQRMERPREEFRSRERFRSREGQINLDQKGPEGILEQTQKSEKSLEKEDSQIFWLTLDGQKRLATINYVEGNQVYGEKLYRKSGVEYRIWDPFRSKLAAALMIGLDVFPFRQGSKVLYLGSSTGTTVSHISDIVGHDGIIFAVEHASRVARDFLDRVANFRKNIVPILQDARHPKQYFSIYGKVDVVYSDIAQPDQTEIAITNCEMFLKDGGYLFMTIKTRSIDVTKSPKKIIENEVKKLEARFSVIQNMDLQPYDKDHAMVVAKYHAKA